MPWAPGDPWPGTPGGAENAAWSPYVHFFLEAAIAGGNQFTLGPVAGSGDALDSGNVYGPPPTDAAPLWVNLSCDCLSVEIQNGASTSAGALSKADAGTLVADIYDPDQRYDPFNPDSPFTLRARTRLAAGEPVRCYAEVLTRAKAAGAPDLTKVMLFTGTVDHWSEPWTNHAGERVATLQATDAVKQWTRWDHPEQNPAGNNDSLSQRVNRIANEFGWPVADILPPMGTSVAVFDSTTLAQPAWEMLNRTLDDELGMAYFTGDNKLRYTTRPEWSRRANPYFTLGCPADFPPDQRALVFDVVVDAKPAYYDATLRNVVNAANSGGQSQTSRSEASIARYGEWSYQRTDLGLNNNAAAQAWADELVRLYAFPQKTLESVTFQPALHALIGTPDEPGWCFRSCLGLPLVSEVIRVVWTPNGIDNPFDVAGRVVGTKHSITPDMWEIEYKMVGSELATVADAFHMGPDPNDLLDSGFVLG